VAGATAIIIAIWTALGPERRNVDFAAEAKAAPG
jgi:SHS family lactate transporter-like MFS transporter